uniref:LITAF domain-containing protein n=1 Tax=Hippocampus comes TaxID=109280 RepID=A0A3Q2Z9Z4_HIPCM
MLFWCSVSSAVLRSSVVALLSMLRKRSMAEMFLWMLCLGRSSLDMKVSVPPSSQRNSMGQQSWPWRPRASPVVTTPVPKFVSHESYLCRSPALTSCPACRAQVTTRVRYRAGTYAGTMCVLFVLCGLVLGCCLLPFLVNHFKDAYHCCPRCHRLLHVHRRRC